MKCSLKILAFISACFLLVGCSSLPTGFERKFANVETNYVERLVLRTNIITLFQTNVVIQPVIVTNTQGVLIPMFQTNLIAQYVTLTNTVLATNLFENYTLTPNDTAKAVAGGAGTIGNVLMPGTGGLITSAILGALSIWFGIRNRQFAGKNDVLSQSAGVLAQIIETGREIMAKTPQGQTAADQFTRWMVAHQAETETIAQISQLVRDTVDNPEAKRAADQILALTKPPTT